MSVVVRKINMSLGLVGQLTELHSVGDHRVRWEWGEPDEQGFYTPSLHSELDETNYQDRLDGAALRRLREKLDAASRDGLFLLMPEDRPDAGRWCIEYPAESDLSKNYYGDTIAEAADKCREALG